MNVENNMETSLEQKLNLVNEQQDSVNLNSTNQYSIRYSSSSETVDSIHLSDNIPITFKDLNTINVNLFNNIFSYLNIIEDVNPMLDFKNKKVSSYYYKNVNQVKTPILLENSLSCEYFQDVQNIKNISLISSHSFDSYDKIKKISVKNRDIRLVSLSNKKWNKVLLKKEKQISFVLVLDECINTNIITGGEDGTIKVWDIVNNTVVKILTSHKSKITAILNLENYKDGYIASIEVSHGEIRIWDYKQDINDNNESCLKGQFQGHKSGINCLLHLDKFDANLIASAGMDNKIIIWNLKINASIKLLDAHDKGVNCLNSITMNDRLYLISGSNDNKCKVWDVENDYDLVAKLEGHSRKINCICVFDKIKNKSLIATGSDDGSIKIWNMVKFECIKEIKCNGEVKHIIHGDFIGRNFIIYAERYGIAIKKLDYK